jgi:hypothetical protein
MSQSKILKETRPKIDPTSFSSNSANHIVIEKLSTLETGLDNMKTQQKTIIQNKQRHVRDYKGQNQIKR